MQTMKLTDLEQLFSERRLSTYYNMFPLHKEKAIEYYRLNLQVSESFYPLLSNLEIILRNAIHNSFTIHYKSTDWFLNLSQPELSDQVIIAKKKIL